MAEFTETVTISLREFIKLERIARDFDERDEANSLIRELADFINGRYEPEKAYRLTERANRFLDSAKWLRHQNPTPKGGKE